MTSLLGLGALSLVAVYSVLTFIAVVVWRLRRTPMQPPSPYRPPVTLLKPLCGAEPDLYENLRSFCVQDYPTFQIVFGVRDANDEAVSVARQLQREFPYLRIDIVVSPLQHGSNRKVSNLINMLAYAKYDLLAIADSDAFVGPDYLATVTAPLLDPKTGMVTCIYRSLPAPGIWSRLGAMYVNDWYMPSVLLTWLFGHRSYASGQTMCLRRETLQGMGGLGSIADYLADDYQLGEQVRNLGLRIVLSVYVPETVQYEPAPDALIGHELRWMRTIRVLKPGSFRFLFISFSLPLALAGLVLTAVDPPLAATGLRLFWTTLVARLGLFCLPRLSDDRLSFGDLWLLPVRDLLLFWVWARAFFISRVTWRGSEFVVDDRGIMRSPS